MNLQQDHCQRLRSQAEAKGASPTREGPRSRAWAAVCDVVGMKDGAQPGMDRLWGWTHLSPWGPWAPGEPETGPAILDPPPLSPPGEGGGVKKLLSPKWCKNSPAEKIPPAPRFGTPCAKTRIVYI